jgi:DNA-binding response OmpR family regulator
MILVVEDELVQLRLVAEHLEGAGYEVMEARDGMAAIHIARTEQPDLVLLDLGLPLGDGFQVMDRLQMLPSTARIPVIVLSSRDIREAQEASRLAGAAAYLQKPVNWENLLRHIAKTLRNSPARKAT